MINLKKYCLIPSGTFFMGSPEGHGKDDERPQHEVKIAPFYLGCYPVTNAEYERFLQENLDVEQPGWWADRRFNQKRQPVVGVSWSEAKRFCEWAGGRLPSEAEWEYACRAGTTTDYWWGDDPGLNRANFVDSGCHWSGKQTSPVGSFEPNPFGVYDTVGNVWEWVQDSWHNNYQGAPTDGSAWETDDSDRVSRGGSWLSNVMWTMAACRNGDGPYARSNRIGFRLALDQFKGCENE